MERDDRRPVRFLRNALIPTAWPLVVDLMATAGEIVVPDSGGALDAANGYRGIRMLDGRPAGRVEPADAPDDKGQ